MVSLLSVPYLRTRGKGKETEVVGRKELKKLLSGDFHCSELGVRVTHEK